MALFFLVWVGIAGMHFHQQPRLKQTVELYTELDRTAGLLAADVQQLESRRENWRALEQSAVALESVFGWGFFLSFLLLAAAAVCFYRGARAHAALDMELRQSEQRFGAIFDNVFGMIFLLGPDGTLLDANQAALAFGAQSFDDVVGRPIWKMSLWHRSPESPECLKQAIQCTARGEAGLHEAHLSGADGQTHFIEFSLRPIKDDTGKVALIVLQCIDLSKRKSTEMALRESEERWKFAVEGPGDGVWDRDMETNHCVYSTRWKEILGFQPDEIGSRAEEWSHRVHPDDRPRTLAALQPHLDGETPFYANEHRLRCKDGSWKWVLGRGVVVRRDPRGRPLRLIGTLTDISERKAAEQAREELQRQLHESQKREVVGILSSGMAHDFNNLLTVIQGNIEMARGALHEPGEVGTTLEQIRKACLRGKELVAHTLAFGRGAPMAWAIHHIQPLVEEAMALFRVALPPGVKLSVSLADAPVYARSIPVKLQQVLLNLCANAKDAVQEHGGHIAVEVVEVAASEPAAQRRDGHTLEHRICLRVSDNGVGMNTATKARALDPFFSTKPQGQGTGLGLAIVHGIVREHDGSMTIASLPMRGTTVEVYLPSVPQSLASAG